MFRHYAEIYYLIKRYDDDEATRQFMRGDKLMKTKKHYTPIHMKSKSRHRGHNKGKKR